jgi:hypothetical protein
MYGYGILNNHVPTLKATAMRGANSIATSGLLLHLDASNTTSYSGTGTTWYDLSGANRNGALNDLIWSSTDGGLMTFDGIDNYVDLGSSSAFNLTNISVSIWAKFDTFATNNFIAGRYSNTTADNGWNMYYNPITQKIRVDARESSALYIANESANTYSVNTWYNITFTKSANTWSIYVNGSLDMSQTIGVGNVSFGTNQMLLGMLYTTFGSIFGKNKIGSTLMYNRALNSTEITQNFNATKTRFGY